VRVARANGIASLRATTLWENHPALALMRRLGFRAVGAGDGSLELQLELR
jgi:RimJ/RimL family protein N-acetyltransferase